MSRYVMEMGSSKSLAFGEASIYQGIPDTLPLIVSIDTIIFLLQSQTIDIDIIIHSLQTKLSLSLQRKTYKQTQGRL